MPATHWRHLAAGLLLGLLLGLAVGTVTLRKSDGAPGDFAEHFVDQEVAWAHYNLWVLAQLRNGDVDDARSYVESALSLNAVVLDELETKFGANPRAHEMLVRIAEYRRRYPYPTASEEADAVVDEILGRASSPTPPAASRGRGGAG